MMTDLSATAGTLLSGITVGIVIMLQIALWRAGPTWPIRLAAGLFGLDVAIYAVAITPALRGWLGAIVWLRVPIAALVCGGIGYYDLLVKAGFADRRLTWRDAMPPLLLCTTGMAALGSQGPVRTALLAVYVLASLALPVRACVTLLGGWPGDLDEARRRLRRPIVAATVAVGLGIVADTAMATATRAGLLHDWLTLPREASLACLAIFVAVQVLLARPAAHATKRDPADDTGDEAKLHALMAAMTHDEVWRREGLTLAGLAAELDVAEYRLRRLIMQRLGHRNFPAFVNSYRIDAARQRLARPDQASTTVAEIAFDSGFSSLSAFNRAFRDVTGDTPTGWREKQMASEKAERFVKSAAGSTNRCDSRG